MSLMADPVASCAKTASSIFASLVRVAPLVQCDVETTTAMNAATNHGVYEADSVVDHLIHGKPLPPYQLPKEVLAALKSGGVALRPYQMEGIAWLRFLQSVKLNGALCDSMGLVSSSANNLSGASDRPHSHSLTHSLTHPPCILFVFPSLCPLLCRGKRFRRLSV